MSKLGKRVVCEECGKKYYDLNREKFACPQCGCGKTRKNSIKLGVPTTIAIEVDDDEEMGSDMDLEPLDDLELSETDIQEQKTEDLDDDDDEDDIDLDDDDLTLSDVDDLDDDDLDD